MNCWNSEPSLIDALSDPIVQAIMTADGVDPQRLKARLSVEMPRGKTTTGPATWGVSTRSRHIGERITPTSDGQDELGHEPTATRHRARTRVPAGAKIRARRQSRQREQALQIEPDAWRGRGLLFDDMPVALARKGTSRGARQ